MNKKSFIYWRSSWQDFFQVPTLKASHLLPDSVTDSITGEFLESVDVRLINLQQGPPLIQSGRSGSAWRQAAIPSQLPQ